ncbi:glycosyltransferase [Microvirga guangxiensis]|nr:glycosyltransferase [Microvirga guangxiensis]
MIAELTGVSGDAVLLKQGWIKEADFYRALAAELNLPFVSNPQLSRTACHPESILAGLAPLAGRHGGFVVAPRGGTLARLLQGPPYTTPLAITTPSSLRNAVFRIEGRMIAHRAAYDLHQAIPALSSCDGASITQILGSIILALGSSICTVAAPHIGITVISVFIGLLFLGIIVLRLASSVLSNPVQPVEPPPRIPDAALPTYTIIVPLYHERRIASRLIAALKRLDYPAVKLDIKLVLELDDEETMAALRSLHLPGNMEIIIAPTGEPRTKPRALNVALPLARGRYTVVYDAEDMPEPSQLRLAHAAFMQAHRNVACLQARLTIDNTNDSWITRLFTIEYAALFDVFNPGLATIGSPVPLGGTSNHFRTAILKKIHGWDAWNVTEDADLGIRLARFGYDVADLASSTFEEAPSTFKAWMGQRTRWMKGFMQTSIAHAHKPTSTLAQLGFWRFYAAAALMAGTVLSALIYPFCTGLVIILWFTGASWPDKPLYALWYAQSLSLFAFGVGSLFIPAWIGLHRRRLWKLLPWTALLPLYYGLVSLAAWRGLWELVNDAHRWNKTSHGLARTSRLGMLQKHHANVVKTKSLKIAPP